MMKREDLSLDFLGFFFLLSELCLQCFTAFSFLVSFSSFIECEHLCYDPQTASGANSLRTGGW